MAEIKKAISSRRGYRTCIKKLLRNVDELLGSEQPLTQGDNITLRDMHEQLKRKAELISTLDAKILESLDNEEEIEAEVLQAEDITSLISTATAKITHHLSPSDIPSSSHPHRTEPRESSSDTATRLPKLNLPQFSRNLLYWQPFWDSFKAAVDTNKSLTGVQKLSYLRAQLRGETSEVIAGFQLTNANYTNSIELLKERFGEKYKQVDAHMQALIDLLVPSITPSSVRQFHVVIESHIRSLTALGRTEDSYGNMLTTILLGGR